MKRDEQPGAAPERRPYEKPQLRRIDLTLEETLGESCKQEVDIDCMEGPNAFLAGS